jgi:basic amino acid/polyamine antiporter, APA family
MGELKKEISLYGLVMIAIGASIGAGIFQTPGKIAAYMQTPSLIIAVWILGAIITLAGALTFAELGGLFPKAGGIYVYLKEAYGNGVAFLYGWTMLVVINTGSLAALAVVFANYFNSLFPNIGYNGRGFVAIAAIVLVTVYNIFGAKISSHFANIFTGLKILGIFVLILTGLYFAIYDTSPIIELPKKIPNDLSGSFALALVGVLFSYGGWQHTSFLSGEARNASVTIPRAMLLGAGAVTLIYVFVNVAYLYLLPIDELAKTETVASDAMQRLVPWGGKFIAMIIAFSVFGTMGIYTLSVPRIFFAMAKDKVFFKDLATLHPIYKTPVNAIVLQSVWAIFLIFIFEKFDDLTKYVVFIDWIFFFLAAMSIFIFRKKMGDTVRPYRAWGYPIVPAVFCIIVAWFDLNILFKEPREALFGLVFLAAGIPLYLFFKVKNRE